MMKLDLYRFKEIKRQIAFAVILLVVIVLIGSMALTSKYDSHPDESNHLSAAVYYIDHWLPPAIGDPSVRDSYSIWGVSYLNLQWAEYFFAGKFIRLISVLVNDPYLGARVFNLVLFVVMAAFFLIRSGKDAEKMIVPSFLLITPQIWYVFSYSNNDAFALFVSMMFAGELVFESSSLHIFLRSASVGSKLRGGILAGVLIGLLIVCKPNYWVFLIFAVIWLVINARANKLILQKYAIIMLVAFSVFGFRIGLDLYVNGETNFAGASYITYLLGGSETKPSKLQAYQEVVAGPEYRPSTLENDLVNSPAEVKLKAKGTPAIEMFTRYQWHRTSFLSFIGTYGYVTIFGPRWYHAVMFCLYSAFLIYILIASIISKNKHTIIEMVLCIAGCVLSAYVSFQLSWSYALQAQGRYLFPVIPILAIFVYSNREVFRNKLIAAFVVASFILSIYSFVFVGLANISR